MSKAEAAATEGPASSDAQSSAKDPVKNRTDNYDVFSLKVKPEVVLKERASCLAPIPETPTNDAEDRDSGSNGKKKTKKGMNKKRPRDAKPMN